MLSRWKIAVAGAVSVLVVGSGLAVANAAESSLAALVVSDEADRSTPHNLAGSTLGGNAYIFLNRDRATAVSFYLDGSATPVSTELLAPFDLGKTAPDGSAYPYDTKQLADGSHTLRAVMKRDARTRTFSARFTVKNSGAPTTTTTAMPGTTSTTVRPTTTVVPTTLVPTTVAPTTSTTKAPTTTIPVTTIPATTTTTTKPTTTTTAAPGILPKNCASSPHVCGYPDATNTGWQHTGVVLKSSGSITVTQNGAVIDGLDVNGSITVKANNVTIKRTRITSSDYYPINYDGYSGLVVEDTEIRGLSALVTAGMSFNNYTARRVHVWGTVDGFKADSNVLIEDSYIHDLSRNATTHNDGMQCGCGGNVTIRHNSFMLTTADGGLFFKSEDGSASSNILVENNLLSGAGWTVDIQAIPLGTNRTFKNNRFVRNSGYGPAALGNQYTWTGNYFDDNLAPVNP